MTTSLAPPPRREAARPPPAAAQRLEDLRAQALRTAESVQAAPALAEDEARRLLVTARFLRDPAAISIALRALGLAARELGDMPQALQALRSSARVADRAGLTTLAGQARMSWALVLADRGETTAALREAERAAQHLRGPDAARIAMQRGLILQRAGRFDEALAVYPGALAALRRSGDRLREARLLNNRGVLNAYLGAVVAAVADLRRAEELYLALEQPLAAADARLNLGFVRAYEGDLVASLVCLDEADERLRACGVERPALALARCEVLLAAGLSAEARTEADRAVAALSARELHADLAEARLLQGQAALADGAAAAAATSAETARRAFGAQRRPAWMALAQHMRVRAAWLQGERSPGLLKRARVAADTLSAAGWSTAAADARLIEGRIALETGRLATARAALERTGAARHHGPPSLRARAWHAQALLRLTRGDRGGAYAALRAGLRVLDDHRALLGATELRAHVSAHGGELARLGLRMASEDAVPERVLAWTERHRASALRLRPARPADDERLATDLAQYRAVTHHIEEAILEGRDTSRLRRQATRLEADVRRRSRHAAGARRTATTPSRAGLGAALGERVLVELADLDGQLVAVTVRAGRARLHRLADAGAAVDELESLRFDLSRVALSPERDSIAQILGDIRVTAGRLDELLLGPLLPDLGDSPLVIVPTGALHAVPWSLLPACRGRSVTVAPSAASWERAARDDDATTTSRRFAGVAGPRLVAADEEVRGVCRHYPHAICLTGASATVSATLRALDGAARAHIASHGRFRAESPLFSSLSLADGPLTVYDLETLGHAPRELVLSACVTGLSAVRPGDELMGLSAALLSLGTQTLIASVSPIPDGGAQAFMLALHARLADGQAPAEALAHVQALVAPDDPAALVTAGGFVCFGRG